MSDLSGIIGITINVSQARPSRAAFGVPMIVTSHTITANRSDSYGNLAEMLAAGWPTYSAGYRWAQAMFSQNPRPRTIKIGRVDAGDADLSVTLPAIYAADPDWYLLVVPDTYSGTPATERTAVLLAAAWAETNNVLYLPESGGAELLVAGDTLASALVGAGYERTSLWYHGVQPQVVALSIDAALIAANSFICSVNGTAIVAEVFAVDSDTTLAAIAAKIQALDPVATAAVTAVAGGTDNDRVIVITAASPWVTLSITDAAVTLGASQASVSVAETTAASTPLAAAIAGRMLAKDAGAANWANQADLAGCTADDLTTAQIAVLELQRANYYTDFGIASMTRLGTCAATLYCDQRRGLDGLRLALEEAAVALLADTDKIPKTADGIAAVANRLVGVLRTFVVQGFLTGDVEQAINTDAGVFTGRTLSGLVIEATGAGAINGIDLVINFSE